MGELIAGRYELEELVGTGGMSSVYRAHDRQLERNVALKVLHERLGADDEHVSRFRHEARAVAQLSHPNVVTVIDRFEEGGRQYIVFEYVDGENLKQLCERTGPLPVRRALEIAVAVADGLAYAHEHGVVHRDVKPQNVLLSRDGEIKVTDFGIARSLDAESGLTLTGTVLGTSSYLSPEQASGLRVTPAADVYSLGVVLYELLAGEVPFPGGNQVVVALKHVNEPPPSLLERRPDVPARLAAAVAQALQKDPERRFASMAAFAAELRACLAERRVGRHGADDGRRRRRAWTRRRPRRASPGGREGGCRCSRRCSASRSLRPSSSPSCSRRAAAARRALPAVRVAAALSRSGASPATTRTARGRPASTTPRRRWRPTGTRRRSGRRRRTTRRHSAVSRPASGLVLDAGGSVKLGSVTVTTDTPGYTAKILAGDSESGPFTDDSSSETVGTSTTFDLNGATARYYVVWITSLPPGDVAHVNEATTG